MIFTTGLTSVVTMSKVENQRQHYEKVAQKYFTARQSKNHILYKNLLWEYFFQQNTFLKKNGIHIFEPMCGFAEGKQIIEQHLTTDFHYEGFDYCSAIIEAVRMRNPSTEVFHLDATRYIPSKRYDLIILIGGLHHIPDHAKDFVSKVHNSLKDNGYFINFEPTENNQIYKIIRRTIYNKNGMFDAETESAFRLKTLNEIYRSSNFEIVDQLFTGLLSYVLYYNPEAFPCLNIGNEKTVKLLFNIDKLFFRNIIGEKFSFATLTLLKKI